MIVSDLCEEVPGIMKGSKGLYFVDRGAGILLSAALSGLNTIQRLFASKPKPVRTVLVIELFEMGAAIMIAPSLHFLKATVPGVKILALASRTTSSAWKSLQLIDDENILAIDDSSPFAFVTSCLTQIWSLRKQNIDLVIDYNLFVRISAVLTGLVKAPRKAGFFNPGVEGLYRGRIHNIRSVFNQNAHISRNFLALTKTAVLEKNDVPNFKGHVPLEELELPHYKSDEAQRAGVMEKLAALFPGLNAGDPLLVVSQDVGPNLSMRNYPVSSFAVCLNTLLKKNPLLKIVLVGTSADEKSASEILDLVKDPRCRSLCGKTSFAELMALLGLARAVFCNDNGIAHFAALTRTAVVTLFSTDAPTMYGPLGTCSILYSYYHCSPCISAYNHKRSTCTDNKCLQAIAPETVVPYLERALAGGLVGRTVNGERPYV